MQDVMILQLQMIILAIHYLKIVLLMVQNVLMVLIVLLNLKEHNKHVKPLKPNAQMILMQLILLFVKQEHVMIHISFMIMIKIVVII